MPSPLSADHPAARPPGRGSVDALIAQARRLKGDVDAVRREAHGDGTDPRERWQRALCDLALHQLEDLDAHLAQLRDGPAPASTALGAPSATGNGALLSAVGSAEWNLLTDEASWSGEFYRILGRDPATPPLTLDELPSLVLDGDRPGLTAVVTDCLVDARPIDGEFRVVRPDGDVRTVHMMGEPVLDADGSTAAMWAVLRDVSELRRGQRVVSETRDSLRHQRVQAGHRLAAELRQTVLPSWRGSPPPALRASGTLDVAAHCLPAATGELIGGDWYEALELPDGETLLSVGDLTGHGVAVTSAVATLLGAVRGMALAGARPGQLLSLLDRLLDATAQPVLGGTVCCRYRPATRTLAWAQAGHPAPLLFRDGTGRTLRAADGAPLTAAPDAVHAQSEEALEVGDLVLLHTDGLVSGRDGEAVRRRLLGLAPRLGGARTAQDCLRTVVEELGGTERAGSACLLVARVTS